MCITVPMQYIISDALYTVPGHVSAQSNERQDHLAEFEVTATLSVCYKNLVHENNLQLLACIQDQVIALWISIVPTLDKVKYTIHRLA